MLVTNLLSLSLTNKSTYIHTCIDTHKEHKFIFDYHRLRVFIVWDLEWYRFGSMTIRNFNMTKQLIAYVPNLNIIHIYTYMNDMTARCSSQTNINMNNKENVSSYNESVFKRTFWIYFSFLLVTKIIIVFNGARAHLSIPIYLNQVLRPVWLLIHRRIRFRTRIGHFIFFSIHRSRNLLQLITLSLVDAHCANRARI